MSRMFWLSLLAAALAACGPSAAATTPQTMAPIETSVGAGLVVSVPQRTAPTIDGTLSPGEWNGAYEALFSDGSSTVFLMHADGDLYAGIRGQPGGVGIVANILVDQGDRVAILHSSAALGTATYQKEGDRFRLEADFVWRARAVQDSPQAEQERQQFLELEGWLASITPRGTPEHTEFRIEMPQGRLRLMAALVGPPDYDQTLWWPSSVDDDSLDISELFRGYSPDEIYFAPDTWALVIAE